MYWAEAIMHAAYLANIMSSDGGKSPWELLKGSRPDISNLRIWGCTCYVRVPAEKRKKSQLQAKATVRKHLGYAQPNFKAFRVLMPDGKVQISRDVSFDESTPPANDARIDMLNNLMQSASQQAAPQAPAQPPVPDAPPQQPIAQHQPPGIQPPPMQPLMAENPLYDEGQADEAADAAYMPALPPPPEAQQAPRRNPPRARQQRADPYAKYLHGLPHSSQVNFCL